MLLQKDKSCLLLIDVQEKLTPNVLHANELITCCHWLMRLAFEINVPILVSEQYTHGLGKTVEPLRSLIPDVTTINKMHFSCNRDPAFVQHWRAINKQHVVIAGIETHVCVLQTALDLKNEGFAVFVVVDAVSSRFEIDDHYALKRMQQAGIILITSEMVFFEWIERAGTPEFKTLSKSFLQNRENL